MATNQEKVSKIPTDEATDQTGFREVDMCTAPAGSKNSLGAESVRDGRPATDDSVVEAMDDRKVRVFRPLARGKSSPHSEGMDSFNDCATSSMEVFWLSPVMSASSARGRPAWAASCRSISARPR